MFLMTHWQPGRLGALRMGIEHGGWCVGCCWMLMAALFALGVMSLGWMAFIAALIAIEKLLPWRALANRGIAVLLLALGLAVAFTPSDVPGLTLPDSPEAEAGRWSRWGWRRASRWAPAARAAGACTSDESMGGRLGRGRWQQSRRAARRRCGERHCTATRCP